ncbi:hypothetical protein DHEL01_v202364 [Diaporthe helianthi]|uniref:MYND-type domain-containing protein n=1 Tax=Diaporthe helianthi TaxID=158607 RepID=A0A2P5I9R3_DIAHE|nr:hypothetical protein DHEL01_v202364 [Diaporthe helianthi]
MSDFLKLDDHEYFLTWHQLPDEVEYVYSGGHHCFVAEIQHCDGFGRYRAIVKDREGSECVVAFYPDSYEDSGFDFKKLKRGRTLAIIDAAQHGFLDGTMGVRVEDMNIVKVVPASLKALREVGPEDEEYSVAGSATQWKCHGCDASKPAAQMSRCGRCKVYAYCSKVWVLTICLGSTEPGQHYSLDGRC